MKDILTGTFIVFVFSFFASAAAPSKAPSSRQDDDCVRGKATPIVKKSVFPKTRFKLQPDKRTGIETVKFNTGDKLIIKNHGCEYYVLTFRFETSRFQGNADDFPFWVPKALELMREIEKGLDPPIDIAKGIKAMECELERRRNSEQKELEAGDEITFGGGEIREFVTVDKIEKLGDKKFAVEISFARGPL